MVQANLIYRDEWCTQTAFRHEHTHCSDLPNKLFEKHGEQWHLWKSYFTQECIKMIINLISCQDRRMEIRNLNLIM